jgi:hypothetical protein
MSTVTVKTSRSGKESFSVLPSSKAKKTKSKNAKTKAKTVEHMVVKELSIGRRSRSAGRRRNGGGSSSEESRAISEFARLRIQPDSLFSECPKGARIPNCVTSGTTATSVIGLETSIPTDFAGSWPADNAGNALTQVKGALAVLSYPCSSLNATNETDTSVQWGCDTAGVFTTPVYTDGIGFYVPSPLMNVVDNNQLAYGGGGFPELGAFIGGAVAGGPTPAAWSAVPYNINSVIARAVVGTDAPAVYNGGVTSDLAVSTGVAGLGLPYAIVAGTTKIDTPYNAFLTGQSYDFIFVNGCDGPFGFTNVKSLMRGLWMASFSSLLLPSAYYGLVPIQRPAGYAYPNVLGGNTYGSLVDLARRFDTVVNWTPEEFGTQVRYDGRHDAFPGVLRDSGYLHLLGMDDSCASAQESISTSNGVLSRFATANSLTHAPSVAGFNNVAVLPAIVDNPDPGDCFTMSVVFTNNTGTGGTPPILYIHHRMNLQHEINEALMLETASSPIVDAHVMDKLQMVNSHAPFRTGPNSFVDVWNWVKNKAKSGAAFVAKYAAPVIQGIEKAGAIAATIAAML